MSLDKKQSNINNIPIEHRYRKSGKYARGVYTCPHCNFSMFGIPRGGYIQFIQGFSTDDSGAMISVSECPNCFESYWCHATMHIYDMWLEIKEFYGEENAS